MPLTVGEHHMLMSSFGTEDRRAGGSPCAGKTSVMLVTNAELNDPRVLRSIDTARPAGEGNEK